MSGTGGGGGSGLPLPGFYVPERAGSWTYRVDMSRVIADAESWRRCHSIAPGSEDRVQIHLLLVDLQKDFCLPEGGLFVGGRRGDGAVVDNQRIASFIYRNLAAISEITCTLDSHRPHQIFFPSFWVDSDGVSLEANREILADDLRSGEVRPAPAVANWYRDRGDGWLDRQVLDYCERLQEAGRYNLFLWPYHCLLGSEGHGLVGLIDEARLFHSFARSSRARLVLKGLDRLTEYYSVLGPEVSTAFDGSSLSRESRPSLTRRLLQADALVIAGQAASHCVRSTLLDLAAVMEQKRPELLERTFILRDCTSPVVVRSGAGGDDVIADFSEQAEEALARCQEVGMRVVTSTDPLEELFGCS